MPKEAEQKVPMTRHLYALEKDFPRCRCGHLEASHLTEKVRAYQKGPLFEIRTYCKHREVPMDGMATVCTCSKFRKRRIPSPVCFCGHTLGKHTQKLKLKGGAISKHACAVQKCGCFGYDDERK